MYIPEIYLTSSIMLLILYPLITKIPLKIVIRIALQIIVITQILSTSNFSILLLRITRLFILKIFSLRINDLRYTYEYIILILTSLLGMLLLIKAEDLIGMYLAIELQSMGMYILAAFSRTSHSREGGLKYYVMGGLRSCIQLLGIRIIYGVIGTTNYIEISYLISQLVDITQPLSIGLLLVFSGLRFKLGRVPFHMWLPDVYQGSPLISTRFFSILPKLALIIRIYRIDIISHRSNEYFLILRILSIIIGSLQAFNQSNIKRLFAFSAISHIGFILIGIAIRSYTRSIFYILIYMLMSISLFAIIMELKTNTTIKQYYNINRILKGLGFKQPLIRLCLVILLFSIAGIPPLRGFYSKFYILERAIRNNYVLVRIIGVLGSRFARVYYIQLIQVIYFNNNNRSKRNDLVLKRSYINRNIIRGLTLVLRIMMLKQEERMIYIGQLV